MQIRGIQDWLGKHNKSIKHSIFLRAALNLAAMADPDVKTISAAEFCRFVQRWGPFPALPCSVTHQRE